ncbi:MAG: hypothetical protein ACO3RV_03580 [Luteolibacter sp.]
MAGVYDENFRRVMSNRHGFAFTAERRRLTQGAAARRVCRQIH